MESFYAVILAAGSGTRMKSEKAKVTHAICGKPMVQWVVNEVVKSGMNEITIVTGHQEEQVRACISSEVQFVSQAEQLGTGHALMQALPLLKGKTGTCLVICGDTPLLTAGTLRRIITEHKENNRALTVLTAIFDDPSGYGRIIRDSNGRAQQIVEHRDATLEQLSTKEINTGIYCFELEWMIKAVKAIDNKNNQSEYYLTDTLSIIHAMGGEIGTMVLDNHEEMMGINDRVQLSVAQKVLNNRIIQEHMRNGVTFINPDSCIVEGDVTIGCDTIIYPGTILKGCTRIGRHCSIGPYSDLTDTLVNNHVSIVHSVITESSIDDETKVGPFAYLRPGSKVGKKVKIGDFVEVKKSIIGDNTKISHLTYVGDAEIGKNVNMGCGVVVVNYDGQVKHKTTVGDNSFIGCNVNLVSPVEVKPNAYIAAGSTITEEVPEFSLAIARSRQTIINDWVIRKGKLKVTKTES